MNQTIAKEILNQLGGNKFLAMTGAKNLVASENSLSFKIGRNTKAVNFVRVTLNALDLYDVEFIKIVKYEIRSNNKVDGVYFDQLQSVFTENTGLYTHL